MNFDGSFLLDVEFASAEQFIFYFYQFFRRHFINLFTTIIFVVVIIGDIHHLFEAVPHLVNKIHHSSEFNEMSVSKGPEAHLVTNVEDDDGTISLIKS